MLVTELKDRDRELGDMMKSHEQQLLVWEQDRQRVYSLEQTCTQYEGKTETDRNAHSTKVRPKQKHINYEDQKCTHITVRLKQPRYVRSLKVRLKQIEMYTV